MQTYTAEQETHHHLADYREKRNKKRMMRRIVIWGLVAFLSVVIITAFIVFLFSVREIRIEGSEQYSTEALLEVSGVRMKQHMFSVSEQEVEKNIKAEFPYIKTVTLEKVFPDTVIITVEEEYTTFSLELLGEYFLFNHNLRLLDRFESFEALCAVRTPVIVKMPLPKSCIVPQGIQLQENCDYIYDMIEALSQSSIVSMVTEIDLRDKFVIKIELDGVTVEFGDYTLANEKFLALYRLLGESGQKKTGHIDLSCYPRCFYDLKLENAP